MRIWIAAACFRIDVSSIGRFESFKFVGREDECAIEAALAVARLGELQSHNCGARSDGGEFEQAVSRFELALLDPQALWSEVRRLGKPGAAVFVMDLVRPDSPFEAREIVERVAGKEHPVLKEDFYNSLCAAFTVSEVRGQLESAGLPLTVEQATARHMRIKGILRR